MSNTNRMHASTAEEVARENEYKEICRVFEIINSAALDGDKYATIPCKLHGATILALQQAGYEVLPYHGNLATIIRWSKIGEKQENKEPGWFKFGLAVWKVIATIGWATAIIFFLLQFLKK